MDKIWSNYTPKHIKLHHYFINFLGVCVPHGALTIRHVVVIMEACRKFCRGVQLRKGKIFPNGEKCHKRQS